MQSYASLTLLCRGVSSVYFCIPDFHSDVEVAANTPGIYSMTTTPSVACMTSISDDASLIRMATTSKRLKKLKLAAHGKHDADAILFLFRNCPLLRDIDFGTSLVGSNALKAVPKSSVTLKAISFGSIQWSDEMCAILSDILVENCLVSLNIRNHLSDRVHVGLEKLLASQSESMRELSVCQLDDRDVAMITSLCPLLTRFNVSTYETISDASFINIEARLKRLVCLSVTSDDTNSDGAVMSNITDLSLHAVMQMQGGTLYFYTVFERYYWPRVSQECWDRLLAWKNRQV